MLCPECGGSMCIAKLDGVVYWVCRFCDLWIAVVDVSPRRFVE